MFNDTHCDRSSSLKSMERAFPTSFPPVAP